MKVIEIDMDNLDKLPEIIKKFLKSNEKEKDLKEAIKIMDPILESIYWKDFLKKPESKASADWKNYETICEEPKIPAPKFKVWSEVVFDYDNKNLTPVYIKIWSVTYSEQTKKWVYNFDWERAIEEEDLRHAIIPEVIQYFRP